MATETKPAVTILYPSRCPVCARNNVPAEERATILYDDAEICGRCGHYFGSRHSINSVLHEIHSPAVRTVVRSLTSSGVFQIDCSLGSWNPVRLCKEDENGTQVSCRINYSVVCAALQDRKIHRWDRAAMACALPGPVFAACHRLSAIIDVNGRHSFALRPSALIVKRRF